MEQTWDGQPTSPDPPFGAVIIVYRRHQDRLEFLLLHRAQLGTHFQGDWAWGSPSGARYPGEPVDVCAQRELFEETGLAVPLQRLDESSEWVCYLTEAPNDATISLSREHDRYEWLSAHEATARILPAGVREQFVAAVARIGDFHTAALDE